MFYNILAARLTGRTSTFVKGVSCEAGLGSLGEVKRSSFFSLKKRKKERKNYKCIAHTPKAGVLPPLNTGSSWLQGSSGSSFKHDLPFLPTDSQRLWEYSNFFLSVFLHRGIQNHCMMCAPINIPRLFPFPFQMMSVSIIFGIMVVRGMSVFQKYFISHFWVRNNLYSSQDFYFSFYPLAFDLHCKRPTVK